MRGQDRLIFFVKAPTAGAVKSRLAAGVGEGRACLIYKRVASHALYSLRGVPQDLSHGLPYDLIVGYHPPDARDAVASWLGEGHALFPQRGGDLGERMENAFRDAFSAGAHRVVLAGSDVPGLCRAVAEEAFMALGSRDAVVAPTFDGGYCLIGFKAESFDPAVFRSMRWGTDTVFDETMEAFARIGARVRVLPKLRDIDTPADLKHLPAGLMGGGVSVVIPVLHEAAAINPLIAHLRSLEGPAGCEIIVADGSPDGDTLGAVADQGVVKVAAKRGRAIQMNAGAAAASGETLIFLHADTTLPRGAFGKVEDALAGGGCDAGAFGLMLDSSRPFIRFISWSAGIRSRLTRVPYGDQAIFMRRDYFESVGGYRDMPLMEDVELMSRIKRLGGRICILDEAARTSARKYLADGPLYCALRNNLLRVLYALGVSSGRLASIYYKTPLSFRERGRG